MRLSNTLRQSALVLILFLGCLQPLAAADSAPLIGFERLASFEYPIETSSATPNQASHGVIPDDLLALDRQRVRVKGFMLPLRVEEGKAVEFLLLKDQNACCFGRMPKITEWVMVSASPGLPIMMDVPIVCSGRLNVGERRESGIITGLYFLDARQPR